MGHKVYPGIIPKTYTFKGTTNGGFALGLIADAAAKFQVGRRARHPDIVHLTGHFLRKVDSGNYEVQVKLVKDGRGLTNIDADLQQNGTVKISARCIFSTLPDLTSPASSPSTAINITLAPPAPGARRIPLFTHPNVALASVRSPSMFPERLQMAEELVYRERNAAKLSGQSDCTGGDNGTLEWAAWCKLLNEGDNITVPIIPLIADLLKNMPSMLPREQRPGPSWFATTVMDVEFKSKIPVHSDLRSERIIGIYSSGRFLVEGRHDAYAEVWTAPSEANTEGWRKNQVCLAISRQMALTIPMEASQQNTSTSRL